MNKNNKENAANRDTYIGKVYGIGETNYKNTILQSIDEKWSKLHTDGWIHIHDLDAYGLTYNCLTFNLLNKFPFDEFESLQSDESKIIRYFDFLKELFENMGNEQSGGMALANFDIDTAYIFKKLNIDVAKNKNIISSCIYSLILWCNNMHTRMGTTSYYITLNIGLGTQPEEKLISESLLDGFKINNPLTFKPNIVFKVKQGVSLNKNDPNYDLLLKSISVTNNKMIPTYLICDCDADKDVDPMKLSVVGCRSRIVANIFGEDNTIGRGNIANISINLPRIALSLKDENKLNLQNFLEKWKEIAESTKDILLNRFYKTCEMNKEFFTTNIKYGLMNGDFSQNLFEIFKNGTLSIGFIGLSETLEIIHNKKYWLDDNVYDDALKIVMYMRNYCDEQTKKYNLNFSLLATSGELISSRFLDLDKKSFNHKCMDKEFYTNSFHVEVDSEIASYEKINKEGAFHKYCNGGSITYVELKEAPNQNIEGIYDIICIAVKSGVRYLGFNFPRDFCNDCSKEGVFGNNCFYCNSSNITRIRRVSGYLEVQDFFTKGKYNESKQRKEN